MVQLLQCRNLLKFAVESSLLWQENKKSLLATPVGERNAREESNLSEEQ